MSGGTIGIAYWRAHYGEHYARLDNLSRLLHLQGMRLMDRASVETDSGRRLDLIVRASNAWDRGRVVRFAETQVFKAIQSANANR